MIHASPASAATAPAPGSAPGAALDARAVIEGQVVMLARLAEIGMEIAEEAGRQATRPAAEAAAKTPSVGDPALAYTRVARAVRLTCALQSRLLADLAALARGEDLARAERRRRVERLVERACEAERAEGAETARLGDEARERLDEADLDAEIDGLSFTEVVARICDDLGLPPERRARIVAAAASAEAAPAAPGAGPMATVAARPPFVHAPSPARSRAARSEAPRLGAAAKARPPPH